MEQEQASNMFKADNVDEGFELSAEMIKTPQPIGELYDARKQKFVGFSIFAEPENVPSMRKLTQNQADFNGFRCEDGGTNHYQVYVSDSFDQLTGCYSAGAGVWGRMAALVSASGSGTRTSAFKETARESSVSLNYVVKNKTMQFDSNHVVDLLQQPDALQTYGATHYVGEILYGANVIVTVSQTVTSFANKEGKNLELKADMEKVTRLAKVGLQLELDNQSGSEREDRNLHFDVKGARFPGGISSFEDARDFIHKINDYIPGERGIGVPVLYVMRPLKTLMKMLSEIVVRSCNNNEQVPGIPEPVPNALEKVPSKPTYVRLKDYYYGQLLQLYTKNLELKQELVDLSLRIENIRKVLPPEEERAASGLEDSKDDFPSKLSELVVCTNKQDAEKKLRSLYNCLRINNIEIKDKIDKLKTQSREALLTYQQPLAWLEKYADRLTMGGQGEEEDLFVNVHPCKFAHFLHMSVETKGPALNQSLGPFRENLKRSARARTDEHFYIIHAKDGIAGYNILDLQRNTPIEAKIYGKLDPFSLTSMDDIFSGIRTQSGRVAFRPTDSFTRGAFFEGKEIPRVHDIDISFDEPFHTEPSVLTALSMLDMSTIHDTRVSVNAINPRKDGFILRVSTWSDTIWHGVDIDWTATIQPRPMQWLSVERGSGILVLWKQDVAFIVPAPLPQTKYLAVKNDSIIVSDEPYWFSATCFHTNDNFEPRLALQAENKKYVQAEHEGGHRLRVKADQIFSWETFIAVDHDDDYMSLTTFNGENRVCAYRWNDCWSVDATASQNTEDSQKIYIFRVRYRGEKEYTPATDSNGEKCVIS